MARFWNHLVFIPAFLALGLSACGSDSVNFSLDTTSLDFGNVVVGLEAEQTVTISHDSATPLALETMPDANWQNDFELSFEPPLPIEVGEAATMTVVFKPILEGPRSGQLELRIPGDLTSQSVSAQGSGVKAGLMVEPRSLNFGAVVVGSTARQTLTLTNLSPADAEASFSDFSNLARCGDPANTAYCLEVPAAQANRRLALAGGATATVTIALTPDLEGVTERGSLRIKTCDLAACTANVSFSAEVVESGLRCNTDPVDFGPVNPDTCLTRNIYCTNEANAPVQIASAGLESAGAEFIFEDVADITLAATEGIGFDVQFCPLDAGLETASFVVVEAGAPAPIEIDLSGRGGGGDIRVSPQTLDFGLASLIAPGRRTLTIENVGVDPLEISNFLVDVESTGVFFAQEASAMVLAPGERSVVAIVFQPTAVGSVQSSLRILSDDSDSPEVVIQLLGEGVNLPPCNAVVSTERLDFGQVGQGQTRILGFDVTNPDAGDCLVSGPFPQAGSSAAFVANLPILQPEILGARESARLEVEFRPTSNGSFNGTFEFAVSDPVAPVRTVAVQGLRRDFGLITYPDILDFGPVGVGCGTMLESLVLLNPADDDVTVESITLAPGSDPGFVIAGLPAPLPGSSATLQTWVGAEVRVSYQGTEAGGASGTLIIQSRYQGQLVTTTVGLTADATTRSSFEESFEPSVPKVDILFVVGDEENFDQERAALSAELRQFFSFADGLQADYQIGVISPDVNVRNGLEGRLLPIAGPDKIITAQSMPTPELALQMRVASVPISQFVPSQNLLEATLQSLSTHRYGDNAGFLRDDARLAVVYVANVTDTSPRSTESYRALLESLKGTRRSDDVSVSLLTGLAGGCFDGPRRADPTPKLAAISASFGGVQEESCDISWNVLPLYLAYFGSGTRGHLSLKGQPPAADVVVEVDGVELPARLAGGGINWTYFDGGINFTRPDSPALNSSVIVRYPPTCPM